MNMIKNVILGFVSIACLLALCACGSSKGFSFEGKELPSGKIGAAYSGDVSIDEANVYYELDYSSDLPKGLSIDDSGKIQGTPREAGSFTFTIVAFNDDTEQSAEFSLLIEKGTLTFPAKQLDEAVVGEPYVQYLGTAEGADGIRYALKDGSVLPFGLTLDAETGRLSGTPENAGPADFVLTASAEGFDPVETQFSLTIAEGEKQLPDDLGRIVFEEFTLPDGLVGEEYIQSVAKAYGTPNIQYKIKYINGVGLPKGLSFDKELGMISGTPSTSTVGSMRFQIIASAEGCDSVTVNVWLHVYDQYVETTRFEAEYIDVTALTGSGYSSSPQGKNMIQPQRDFGDIEVSNNHALGYLHKSVSFIFEFTSDKATDAVLNLRIGSELGYIIFNPSLLGIKVNGEVIDYDPFVLDDPDDDATTKDFMSVKIGTIQVKEGDNTIAFEVFELTAENNPYNEPLPEGTMKAKGPIFDYIELTETGDARIGWRPVVSNLK
ncbi:MAG: putative Ig domain-containing protein [Lachnospiraceae bacterium]|nr:putative Ig domain-containing protein [Lachnospiraceae bacterium]